ncbi:PTPLA-domain-containing protein [Stereum hirsutum FP-91666 SS1]|uniref:PTPLA-domain-containing protein n=1 Tax=Stereum hirsutum (strain FP-91666) TaxID=721885 RepID=UPI0004449396|nr:PTPLA-domain-containing protein [Stereum hirsutum FP-91666 SS1]EIM82832.1 PTPLA-domain-containing protein [Stereum hirsutum FP-91666 SS1]
MTSTKSSARTKEKEQASAPVTTKQQAPPPVPAKKKASPLPLKIYLILYNTLSALAWSYILYLTASHLLTPGPESTLSTLFGAFRSPTIWVPSYIPPGLVPLYKRATTLYSAAASPFAAVGKVGKGKTGGLGGGGKGKLGGMGAVNVGTVVKWVQSCAVLEVAHVLAGWVRSPLGTTGMQVASRLWTVWGVVERFDVAKQTPFFASLLLAWSLTESIRYTYYTLSLLTPSPLPTLPSFIIWLRYTTFFVLYPLGAGSEAMAAFVTLPEFGLGGKGGGGWGRRRMGEEEDGGGKGGWGWEAVGRAGLFFVWWPGLYVMYTHMMKQRRKIFGGAGGAGKRLGREMTSGLFSFWIESGWITVTQRDNEDEKLWTKELERKEETRKKNQDKGGSLAATQTVHCTRGDPAER